MQWVSEAELRFLIGLLCSLTAGFVIGAERESRGKDAGISTHMLVIAGAMLFTFMSSMVDPASKSRIAAQVVTGIGFLGAGLILKEKNNVKNLTTAASLWTSAGVGMAFGYQLYVVGAITTVAIALIPKVPHLSKKPVRPLESDKFKLTPEEMDD